MAAAASGLEGRRTEEGCGAGPLRVPREGRKPAVEVTLKLLQRAPAFISILPVASKVSWKRPECVFHFTARPPPGLGRAGTPLRGFQTWKKISEAEDGNT